MATSTIYLYQDCKINKTKNMIVDSIEDYLSTLVSMTKYIQYTTCELKTKVKLNIEQEFAQAIFPQREEKYLNAFNYCKITYKIIVKGSPTINRKEVPLYYFIDKINWKSENTIELELSLDVLNTYRFDLESDQNGNLFIGELSNQTHITREHKNRYKMVDGFEGQASAIVDLYNEEIYPPLYKKSDYKIKDDDAQLDNCYLIYRNQNAPTPTDYENPVDCFVLFDKEVEFSTGPASNVISPERLEFGYVYRCVAFKDSDGNIWNYKVADDDNALTTDYVLLNFPYLDESNLTAQNNFYLCFYKLNDKKIIYWQSRYETYEASGKQFKVNPAGLSTSYLRVTNMSSKGTTNPPLTISLERSKLTDKTNAWTTIEIALAYDVEGTWTINSINDLDRSDSKLIKIIKLPYRCFNLKKNSEGKFGIPDNFVFSKEIEVDGVKINALKLLSGNGDLSGTIQAGANVDRIVLPLYSWKESFEDDAYYIDGTMVLEYLAERSSFEPKLLHSNFYYKKIVYDSFSYLIQFENLSFNLPSSHYSNRVTFTFLATQTINSKFLFDFSPTDAYRNFINAKKTSDFDYIINVARNNEIPLYNVAYINYIRTGYNYDVKKLQQDVAINWATFGVSAITSILGAVAGGPIGAGAVISGVGGMAGSLINRVKTQIQGEESNEQKQNQLKNQSASVSGSDDVDLMSYYSDNKLHLLEYECSKEIKTMLNDLFFYTGYKTSRFSGDLKNFSRTWFNFIQAELVFDWINKGVPQECLNELIAKYKDGVTFFHKVTTEPDGTPIKTNWNFEQDLENAETLESLNNEK